ncbi:hypothetical protein E3Z27_18630 [Pseudomonas mediterranea]|uniref:hypothetical protein n=1 Tax=Pseudomonas mediterranea TaxID=183795 RepID=UPI0013192D83|nr:hypothetical protein [Pseudomonas mediterranea]QHA83552.1 hypothetical protein E3Z27_18630 [Pseudomonas mediterranea]
MTSIQNEMAEYANGANLNSSTLNLFALGGAGVGAIGLATNSHSDLYKSAGAIILTSLGFKSWGNFEEQSKIYSSAYYKLGCAIPHVESINKNGDDIRRIYASEAGASYIKLLKVAPEAESLTDENLPQAIAKGISNYRTLENKAIAENIIATINRDASADALNLQKIARTEVERDSFKTEESIKVIYNTAFQSTNFIPDAGDNTGLSKLYADVISDKVKYLECMQLSSKPEP